MNEYVLVNLFSRVPLLFSVTRYRQKTKHDMSSEQIFEGTREQVYRWLQTRSYRSVVGTPGLWMKDTESSSSQLPTNDFVPDDFQVCKIETLKLWCGKSSPEKHINVRLEFGTGEKKEMSLYEAADFISQNGFTFSKNLGLYTKRV